MTNDYVRRIAEALLDEYKLGYSGDESRSARDFDDAELEDVAAVIEKVSPFIPVTERMPEVDRSAHGSVECIVLCDTGLVTAMYYTENRYAKTEKGRRPRWEWNRRLSVWNVTHWMPLPAALKVK